MLLSISAANNNGVLTNNFINITLADINNTFVPNNDVDVDNTNTDDDTTMVSGTNTNTVTGRRKRSARGSSEEETGSWTSFFRALKTDALGVLGIKSESAVLSAFANSIATTPLELVSERAAALGRKVRCARSRTSEDGCVDKGVCLHFADEHAVFGGNVVVRGVEVYLVAVQLRRGLVETAALWDLAVSDRCHSELHCTDMKVASCFEEDR